METCGVYKVVNTGNNKVYIGSSKNIERRKSQHFSQLRKGCHPNRRLQRDWYEYGQEYFIFEVLEEVKDIGQLYVTEQRFLDLYKAAKEGYNIYSQAYATSPLKQTRSREVVLDHAFVMAVNWVERVEKKRDICIGHVSAQAGGGSYFYAAKKWAELRGYTFPMEWGKAAQLAIEISAALNAIGVSSV